MFVERTNQNKSKPSAACCAMRRWFVAIGDSIDERGHRNRKLNIHCQYGVNTYMDIFYS
jgi:hypothetical protein